MLEKLLDYAIDHPFQALVAVFIAIALLAAALRALF
jgi:hypothetical protein